MKTASFLAHHSAWGAYATFCLGLYGRGGGFALSDVHSPEMNVYIGYAREGDAPKLLPFVQGKVRMIGEEAYTGQQKQETDRPLFFPPEQVSRSMGWASDSWQAGDLTFRILTPFGKVPVPGSESVDVERFSLAPAVLAQLTLDNRNSASPGRIFFGLQGVQRVLSDSAEGLVGVAMGRRAGIACPDGPGVQEVLDWDVLKNAFSERPWVRRLGNQGGLLFTVPAGEERTFTVALGTYQEGIITTGIDLSFYYTRLFGSLEEVLRFALDNQAMYIGRAEARDRELRASGLNEDRQFMLAHFTHSYLASTQLMATPEGEPFWLVNEGEYQMMNTFDLTVDQIFWEMVYHPWTVKNNLEMFLRHYSYRDQCGLAFTHDMGVRNTFTRQGHSSYELPNIHGCFSYMTHEELDNWVLCGVHYGLLSGDEAWLRERTGVFQECLASMIARDANGDGIMDVDSNRCIEGSEITTYDSLDASLGQARNNLYLAVKTWACYIGLEQLFRRLGLGADADRAAQQARRTADSVVARFDQAERYIPAVFEGGNRSRIIPAIEGLVYPHLLGDADAVSPDGRFGPMVRALREHLTTVLEPGVCIDAVSGGWKLSSTSNNTWMSKIAICQYVAEKILGFDFGKKAAEWDAVHASWQQVGCAEQAATDQIQSDNGKDLGSRLYPRMVSAVLWLRPE